MRKAKVFAILFFCFLVAEEKTVLAYYNELWTPARLVSWLLEPLPIKLFVYEIICMAFLFGRQVKGAGMPARIIPKAIYISMGTLLFVAIYGLATGGSTFPLNTQMHVWLFALLFALTCTKVLGTADDFNLMHNAIIVAATWRAIIALIFYIKIRGRPWNELPAYLTTHEDTVLFVSGVMILISRCIEYRSKKYFRYASLAVPIILTAIQLNNRRLAWASLALSLLIAYSMLPAKSKVAKKINFSLKVLGPFLAIYAAIGWGRPEAIFKPLAPFSSMSNTSTDNSNKAREIENSSLITMMLDRPLLGTGFGHEWVELDSSFTVHANVFPMYHYSPHNTVLALLAFCGSLGFAALWMVLPISVYLNARAYRQSPVPLVRTTAMIGIVDVAIYLNQAYGDMAAMNNTHMMPNAIVGLGIATGARLVVQAGALTNNAKTRTNTIHPTA
jgi:hypothetical protein